MNCLISEKLGQGLDKPKGEVTDLISSIIVKLSNDAIISDYIKSVDVWSGG